MHWQVAILLVLASPFGVSATIDPRQAAPPTVKIQPQQAPSTDTSSAQQNVGFNQGNATVAPPVNAQQPDGDVSSIAQDMSQNAQGPTIENGAAAKGTVFGTDPGEYLYVWSGAEGRRARDRLITLDFNRNSPTYGQAIAQTLVPTAGNEPHHCGLSLDKSRLLCGGFFSVLRGQDDIFVFDMANPANPQLVRSSRGILGAVPDDFIPLTDGTYIVSEMGSSRGGVTPGRVAKVDRDGNILGEFPRPWQPIPRGGYNPHGVAVREDLNLLVTSDFLGVETALNGYRGELGLRNTLRVWDLRTMNIRYSFSLPTGTGTMDTKLLHNSPEGMGFVGGTGNGQIWVFNTANRYARRVIDLNAAIVPPWFRSEYQIDSQMMQISPDDTRLYIPYASKNDKWTGKSGFYSGVAVYDVSDPYNPRLLQNMAFPAYAGPHLGQLYGDRLVTAGYFLDMDNIGTVHLNGDHVVRAMHVNPDGTLTQDVNFQVDFNRLIPGLWLRPHGLATIRRQ